MALDLPSADSRAGTIRAVFFDLDDTLVDHSGAERAAAELFFKTVAARTRAASAAQFVEDWNRVQEGHIGRFLSGELTFQEQRRARVRDVLRGDLADDEADEVFAGYLRHYEASWRCFDDVLPCLEALGVERVAVLTNGDSRQQAQKLTATGIADRFMHVIASGEVGHAKPDARIFDHACRRVGVPPANAIHIGDSLHADYEGALSAGLRAIWLDRSGRSSAASATAMSVRSLTEIPELIASI